MGEEKISYYRRGADDGLRLGAVMAVAMLAFLWLAVSRAAASIPTMYLVALVAALAVPVVSARQLRRSWLSDERRSTWGDLWTQGVTAFACGALIMALASYIYIGLLRPSYILDMINTACGYYQRLGTAEALDIVRRLQDMTSQGLMPTPVMLAVQLMLLSIFAGSLWAMIVAAVLRLRRRHLT